MEATKAALVKSPPPPPQTTKRADFVAALLKVLQSFGKVRQLLCTNFRKCCSFPRLTPETLFFFFLPLERLQSQLPEPLIDPREHNGEKVQQTASTLPNRSLWALFQMDTCHRLEGFWRMITRSVVDELGVGCDQCECFYKLK